MKGKRLRVALVSLVAAVAVAIPSASTADIPIQVFLLAGQSNMVGRAKPVSNGTGPVDNLLLLRNGGWQPAADPLGPLQGDSGVGPGMTFGIGVLGHEPPGTKVGLVMCARSATPVTRWLPGGDAFKSCNGQVKNAIKAGGVIAGVVFLQGEYEATNGTGGRWAAKFPGVLAGFQDAFGSVPFVLGQIGDLAPQRAPYAPDVRAAQANADAEFIAVDLTTSLDLPVFDGVHFTVDSAKQLGYRFADQWWALKQQFPSVTGLSTVAAVPGSQVTIMGAHLDGATGVSLGKAPAAYTVDGPGQITATVPDTATDGPVTVATPYGAIAGPNFSVLPLIDSFSPASGRRGTKVLVQGRGFYKPVGMTLDGQQVKFRVITKTELRMKVLDGATSGPIVVTTRAGTTQPTGTFTVLP